MKKFSFIILSIFILIFFVSCVTTFVVHSEYSFTTSPTEYQFSNNDYVWPLPGFYDISSNFGLRISPVTGASKYHSGIDIPSPERYKNIFCIFWKSYISWFQWRQWLYDNDKQQQLRFLLFTCCS